ncbi:MAG: leucine-rich repeat domain-containing protein, partial [Eggerthellaceae bacterium]|nr:leucine-rich repeat domain-containing protein [Eggerthellaceae bacterium]
MEKVKERLSVAKAMRILLAAVLAATLCVPTTYAFAEGGQSASDDGVHVLSLGAEEGAGDPAVPSTHAKTSNYALIASDGYVYPCDAKGNRIDTVWAKSYGAGSIDAITALFVDSNVTKLERNALKYKYAGYSRTYSSTFYSAYSTTLQTVTFKLASNGRNACRSIGASFFSGCKKLRSVTNLDKTYVDTMGSSAFARCSALTAISLPSTLKGTLDNTFYECTSLKTVSGMEKTKVTYLYFTFRSCKSLQSITLPKTCTKAGLPFIYCTALKSLTVNSPTVVQNLVANFEKDLLFNVAGGGAKNGAWINVPSNLVSAYKNNYYSKYSQDTYYPNVASHIRAIPASATPAVTPTKKTNWTRLWGNGPLDTMRKVVQAGWASGCGGTVVVATSG